VLRSSLREYIASEFMHAAGVATSRALSLVATSEPVVRFVAASFLGHPPNLAFKSNTPIMRISLSNPHWYPSLLSLSSPSTNQTISLFLLLRYSFFFKSIPTSGSSFISCSFEVGEAT
jgi:hypothetical protein